VDGRLTVGLEGFLNRLLEPLTGWWTAPGSPLRLRRPPGFEPTDAFPGLVQPAGGGSIMVQTLPAPYGEVAPGFDREALLARGMALNADLPVLVDGRAGRLLRCSQPVVGHAFGKWILLLDAEGRTVIAMATWPAAAAAELEALMKATLLGAEMAAEDRRPRGPGFALGASPLLRPAGHWGGMAIHTPDGRFTPGEPPEAMLLAGWGLQGVDGAEARRRFATNHIGQVDEDLMGLSVTTQREVVFGGLPGFETQAVGRSRSKDRGRAIYEAILFDAGRYAVIVGVAHEEKAGTYVPAFQALASGFRP
jgi:hypothetical protein